jgi:hypothetical protein
LGGLQDEHAEKHLEESQRGSGQDAPASRCPLEQELPERRPQWHGKGKVPVRSEATHGDVSAVRITTLELRRCAITGAHAEWLAGGVLAQCRALVHLDLGYNDIGDEGSEILAGVLGHCASLAHLDLSGNYIRAGGVERFAGVLGQCAALAYLDLDANDIGPDGAESLAGALGQCASLAYIDLTHNDIGPDGAESLAGVLGQCAALAHLDLSCNGFGPDGADGLQEFWRSAQRWLTSISVKMTLDQAGQRVLQECWGSAQRWLTSISERMASEQTGQRVLQEFWRSAQRWLTSISNAMASKLSRKGRFELRGVVMPLVLFYRHLALLACCHLFSRHATRNSDILYTYSAVAVGLALWL